MTFQDPDTQYQNLLIHILRNGDRQNDRTSVGTLSTFGGQMRFDLSKGFPLLTTKKLNINAIIVELLWFLGGHTNNNWLKERGVGIWNEWAKEDGDLGPIYGKQWRAWPGDPIFDNGDYKGREEIDQLAQLIKLIIEDPASRRQIVTAWNPADNPKMALTPCHCLFQTRVANGRLDLQLYQRSADAFLGLPFNIASYAILTHILADQCGLNVGEFIWTGGDVHLYSNHLDQAREQILRKPRESPTLKIKRVPAHIGEYELSDFIIEGYDPHPHIKADIAV